MVLSPVVPLASPSGGQRPFPLRPIQQAYWLGRGEHIELGNTAVHSYFEIEGRALDVPRLEAAWQRVVERHGGLRLVFLPEGQQRILQDVPPYRFARLDLRSATPEEATRQVESIRDAMATLNTGVDRYPLYEIRATFLPNDLVRIHVSLDLLITDAASTQTKIDDWLHFYAQPDVPLPPIGLSFRDYVLAEAAHRESGEYARAREAWLAHLPELPPAPELPLARSAGSVALPRQTRRRGRLAPDAWRRLKERAKGIGVGPYRLLLTAFVDVLGVWCARPTFTLNLPIARRLPCHPDVDRLVGNFSSPLLVAADARARRTEDTFAHRAQRLSARIDEDLGNAAFSGVDVMRELGRLHGDPARGIMPIVFNRFRNHVRPESGMRLVHHALRTPQVWLEHQVAEEDDGSLAFTWASIDELFPAGMLDDVFGEFGRHLRRVEEGPERLDERLGAEPPRAQLEQRAAVNATAAPVPEGLLQGGFERQAREAGGRLAVVSGNRKVTYAELDRGSAALAETLRSLGAAPGRLVAVIMEKGWEQVLAVLAILRAGAAYLPVDPSLPPERQKVLLELGGVEIALTQSRLAAHVEELGRVRTVPVAEDLLSSPGPVAVPPPPCGPEDLAYVIFTSGSTGVPKGVMIDHRGALNTVADVNERFAVGPEDRVFGISALGFDLSVWDIFGTLAAGGTLVLPEHEATRDPARWSELLRDWRVTVWNSAPSLMEMLLAWAEGRGGAIPDSLRCVMLSGDWIAVSLPERLRGHVPSASVVSLGGATEASVWSIAYPIGEVDPGWRSIPYGKPMVNQTFCVLDDGLEPRPVWCAGELYIGGIGLAKGYWRDPERTAERFLVHPRTGERLYRTGDLGRYLPDGNIEFLGRADFQVKIRGFRIELGEIEAALAQHRSVREAVVVARQDRPGQQQLLGYVVCRAGSEAPTPSELEQHVRERLPEYMVPSSIRVLDAFPLSPNGKVDRRALPRHEADARAEFVPPRSPEEQAIADVWRELLGVPRVGAHDNFFELGGNSLLGIQALARLNALGIPLTARHLFAHRTVEALARAAGERAQALGTALVPFRAQGAGRPFFCVHAVGGHVLAYRELAACLRRRPFYGLQSPSLEPGGRTFASLEETASAYLEAIRGVQPAGPYHLGGWSLGGAIAFEMATQLLARGEQVASLLLIDAEVPSTDTRVTDSDDATLLALFAMDMAGSTPAERPAVSREELAALPEPEQVPRLLERLKAGGALPADMTAPGLEVLVSTFKSNVRAAMGWTPAPYPNPVVLLKAAGSRFEAELGGWRKFAPRLHVEHVPGDHHGILARPHVEQLARHVRAALDSSDPAPDLGAGSH